MRIGYNFQKLIAKTWKDTRLEVIINASDRQKINNGNIQKNERTS